MTDSMTPLATVLSEVFDHDDELQKRLEQIAQLATVLLDAPVAQVNILLEDRQRSLVSVGHEPDWNRPKDVPLDYSFCRYPVTTGLPLLIEDAREHPLVRDNRATTESGIESYAAVPFTLNETSPLGTICVVDFEPRSWSETDLSHLDTLKVLAVSIFSYRLSEYLAEKRAQSSEGHYKAIFENSPLPMIEFSGDLQVREANPAMLDLLGYQSSRELRALDLAEDVYVDREDRHHLKELLREKGWVANEEIRLKRRDGNIIWACVDAAEVDGEGGESRIHAFARDITRERDLHEQLLHSQKMEVVGTLAGGVAHDFNNLLTVILANSDLLLAESSAGSEHQQMIQEVRQAAEQAQHVTSQLLAFSRKTPTRPESVNVNQVIGGMERILKRLIRKDIELTLTLEEELPTVQIDGSQLEQVIMNLVINGQDAMHEGGRIRIRTLEIELSHAYAETHLDAKPGSHVMITVSDTGEGMDLQTQKRVFEPFFTTKPEGEGTGLGLSTVYGLVQEAGGHIGVYSEVGRGTAFKVYLPVDGEGVSPVDTSPSSGSQNLEGSETLLLVDDDETVGASTRRVLEAFGYRVILATGVEEALSVWERMKEDVDAVLSDVVLPGRKGPELIDQLRAEKSDIPALFLSGYESEHLIQTDVLTSSEAFVEKPFTPLTLVTAVRNLLDRVSAGTAEDAR